MGKAKVLGRLRFTVTLTVEKEIYKSNYGRGKNRPQTIEDAAQLHRRSIEENLLFDQDGDYDSVYEVGEITIFDDENTEADWKIEVVEE